MPTIPPKPVHLEDEDSAMINGGGDDEEWPNQEEDEWPDNGENDEWPGDGEGDEWPDDNENTNEKYNQIPLVNAEKPNKMKKGKSIGFEFDANS